MSLLDTNGLEERYYIRVQRNMIAAGVTSKSDYYDLYISEITTDPTSQSICECCSVEDEKVQRIKFKFHLRSRKDENFEMIVGSTCIEQFDKVDPDELKHALLLFKNEQKRVKKLRKADAAKARAKEYETKYSRYIEYLNLVQEVKGFLPASLATVYQVLTDGTKVFRDEHEEVLQQAMDETPVLALEELRRKRQQNPSRADEWHKARQQAAEERRSEPEPVSSEQSTSPTNTSSDLEIVSALLLVAPDNQSLRIMQDQLRDGRELIPAQQAIVKHLMEKVSGVVQVESPNVDEAVIRKMQDYLDDYKNPYIEKMLGLATRGVSLTQVQYIKIDEIIDGVAAFEEKFTLQKQQLNMLNRSRLDADQRKKFKYLNEQFSKARHFGKFYTEHAEKNFVTDLAKLASNVEQTVMS